jgi:hypothetical protein
MPSDIIGKMSVSDSTENRGYFLGIEGEQLGPLSEKELLEKINQGQVPPQTLIWWDGQVDWQPISEISEFKTYYEKPIVPAPPLEPSPTRSKPLQSPPSDEPFATFSAPDSPSQPVFTAAESNFPRPSFLKTRAKLMGGIFAGLCLVTLAFLYFNNGPAPAKKPLKRISKDQLLAERKAKVSKALSELLLKPDQSIQALQEIVRQDSKDEPGAEAVTALLENYRQTQKYQQAGDLLLELKRPDEAARLFLMDPTLSAKAESALFQAYQATKGKEQADFLIQDIKLLLVQLKNPALAVERIQLFEKTFPALSHPYSYYLLPSDQRIQNIFNRLSFHFVQELMKHMTSEFPQVTLVNRPLIEVKRNASGEYRIVARYQGDVLLSNDRLRNIYFIFWLVDGQWVLVDTNLTRERQRFAAITREKYNASVMTPERMIQYLETVFQTQFPNKALHEMPTSNEPTSK